MSDAEAKSFEGGYSTSPSDILTLNVGGTVTVQVRRRVLTQVDGSLLAAKFSGRWQEESALDGQVFIDYSSVLFLPLLEFLRCRVDRLDADEMWTMAVAPSQHDFQGNVSQFRRFLAMVDYYGLLEAMYPMYGGVSEPNGYRLLQDADGLSYKIDTPQQCFWVQSFRVDFVPDKADGETHARLGWLAKHTGKYIGFDDVPGVSFAVSWKDPYTLERTVTRADGSVQVRSLNFRNRQDEALLIRDAGKFTATLQSSGRGVFYVSHFKLAYY